MAEWCSGAGPGWLRRSHPFPLSRSPNPTSVKAGLLVSELMSPSTSTSKITSSMSGKVILHMCLSRIVFVSILYLSVCSSSHVSPVALSAAQCRILGLLYIITLSLHIALLHSSLVFSSQAVYNVHKVFPHHSVPSHWALTHDPCPPRVSMKTRHLFHRASLFYFLIVFPLRLSVYLMEAL